MDKADALRRIIGQVELIDATRSAGRHTEAFKKWRRDTEVLLGKIFGSRDHENVKEFSGISYALRVVSKRTSEADHTAAFERGLGNARALLESIQTEIREFWPDASSPDSQPPAKGISAPQKTTSKKPRLFIGSSVEGLPVAEALQLNLEHVADTIIWYQGVFGLSEGTLESLAEKASNFDFAALVLTPDDVSTKRNVTGNAPRDNVLFELGLFIGALGRGRTYIVHPRDVEMQMPSDLAGISAATYEHRRVADDVQASVGTASTRIKQEIQRRGPRE